MSANPPRQGKIYLISPKIYNFKCRSELEELLNTDKFFVCNFDALLHVKFFTYIKIRNVINWLYKIKIIFGFELLNWENTIIYLASLDALQIVYILTKNV